LLISMSAPMRPVNDALHLAFGSDWTKGDCFSLVFS
jgi:hypothetical protein